MACRTTATADPNARYFEPLTWTSTAAIPRPCPTRRRRHPPTSSRPHRNSLAMKRYIANIAAIKPSAGDTRAADRAHAAAITTIWDDDNVLRHGPWRLVRWHGLRWDWDGLRWMGSRYGRTAIAAWAMSGHGVRRVRGWTVAWEWA